MSLLKKSVLFALRGGGHLSPCPPLATPLQSQLQIHHTFVTSDVLHSMSEPVTQYHQHTIDTHKTAELIYIQNQLFVIYL